MCCYYVPGVELTGGTVSGIDSCAIAEGFWHMWIAGKVPEKEESLPRADGWSEVNLKASQPLSFRNFLRNENT